MLMVLARHFYAGTAPRERYLGLIRRSRHIVQDRPSRFVRWADIPYLSARDRRCPVAWQQVWQQSARPPTVQEPNRISSSERSRPDRFKLARRPRPVFRERCRTVVNCNPSCQLERHTAHSGQAAGLKTLILFRGRDWPLSRAGAELQRPERGDLSKGGPVRPAGRCRSVSGTRSRFLPREDRQQGAAPARVGYPGGAVVPGQERRYQAEPATDLDDRRVGRRGQVPGGQHQDVANRTAKTAVSTLVVPKLASSM